MRISWGISFIGLAFALVGASPAPAQRPSLVDLQAALDAVVSAPPPPAVGTARFVNSSAGFDSAFPLVTLRLQSEFPVLCSTSCAPAGLASFDPVEVTVEDTGQSAELITASLTSLTFETVTIGIPTETNLVTLVNARVESVSPDDVAGRRRLALSFEEVQLEIQGTTAGYTPATALASGCQALFESTADLAGNAPSNLALGETAGTFFFDPKGFGTTSVTSPSIVVTRVPQEACSLRTTAAGLQINGSIDRLWESQDLFPGARRDVVTIDLFAGFVPTWSLTVESGVLEEVRTILMNAGGFTSRAFDPATGVPTATTTAAF